MLSTFDGKRINQVPHREKFLAVERELGPERVRAVRADLDRIIDEMRPAPDMDRRAFNSSFLGSKMKPWPFPLAHLDEAASQILGVVQDEHVQEEAIVYFCLFMWECIVNRDEEWVFYNPDSLTCDRAPNEEDSYGNVYFERYLNGNGL